jgi:hypothetical protein
MSRPRIRIIRSSVSAAARSAFPAIPTTAPRPLPAEFRTRALSSVAATSSFFWTTAARLPPRVCLGCGRMSPSALLLSIELLCGAAFGLLHRSLSTSEIFRVRRRNRLRRRGVLQRWGRPPPSRRGKARRELRLAGGQAKKAYPTSGGRVRATTFDVMFKEPAAETAGVTRLQLDSAVVRFWPDGTGSSLLGSNVRIYRFISSSKRLSPKLRASSIACSLVQ